MVFFLGSPRYVLLVRKMSSLGLVPVSYPTLSVEKMSSLGLVPLSIRVNHYPFSAVVLVLRVNGDGYAFLGTGLGMRKK